ncbi:MAG: N-6 DNA methylase [Magnetococcales bacterium]|nr:N-6 DNA methylase [Magnetococcales bacterium]
MLPESSQASLWRLLDRMRGTLNLSEMPVVLASLIFLRWVDFQEAEQEAIASFDDLDHTPVLPPELHWRAWHRLEPKELHAFFQDRLVPALHELGNNRHAPLATQLHHVIRPMEGLVRVHPMAMIALVRWLTDQPFETPHDRRNLLAAFDSLWGEGTIPFPAGDGYGYGWGDGSGSGAGGGFGNGCGDGAGDDSGAGFGCGYGDGAGDGFGSGYGGGSGDGAGDGFGGGVGFGSYPIARSMREDFNRTPPIIARLVAALANLSPSTRIYDPCFGAADLLSALHERSLASRDTGFSRPNATGLAVSGIEVNPGSYIIGLTRLILAGVEDPQLELGNALERTLSTSPQNDGFDLVVAHPPWGARIGNSAIVGHFSVQTNDSTSLFVQHALSQLRVGGQAILILPLGNLFRSGPERRLRQMLVESHTVAAVISLPNGAFLPQTGIQASILVVRRGGSTQKIRMVDASSFIRKKVSGKQASTFDVERISELVQAVQTPHPSRDGWDVTTQELEAVEWDFTPRRRDESTLSSIFESLGEKVRISSIGDCCEVSSGRQIRSTDLVDEPPVTQPIPYVRIKDLHRGQVSRASSWLSPEAVKQVEPGWKLRAGDVLLSKSGTIGKAGIVRNGAVGAIPAGGFFVLRPQSDLLDPHFLQAYLNSNECRAWMNDRARGSTIQHLSKTILAELPVPLPPLQMQQRTAAQHREHGVDAMAYLAQLLTSGESDPIAEWVDDALRHLEKEPGSADQSTGLHWLLHGSCLGGSFTGVWHDVRGGLTEGNSLNDWVTCLEKAVDILKNVVDVPQGSALYSLLQQSLIEFQKAAGKISGHLPNEAKARDLNEKFTGLIASIMEAMVGAVSVIIANVTTSLKAGSQAEIEVFIQNKGPLPLRDLQVSTHPEWGEVTIPFLPEMGSRLFDISGTVPRGNGQFSLWIKWSALAMNGERTEGQRELAFEVDAGNDAHQKMAELGGSPYVCGDPVGPTRDDVFFGREDLLECIRRQVMESGNVVLLEGNRRAGKSSILRHLEGTERIPGWMGIYCSLQGAEGSRDGIGVPTAEVFRTMAVSIAKGLASLGQETPLPNGDTLAAGKKLGIARACKQGIGEDAPFADFQEYLETALDVLQRHHLGLLLMTDEFDKLQEGIDHGVTSPQVPENIRFLVHEYPRFSAILTGSRRLKRLREEYWSALFGLGTRFGVTVLPEEAAHRLVTDPVKGRLSYSREAVAQACQLTARQPYLLQCLCNRIFDLAAQMKTRSITLDLVNQSAEAIVEDNEHFASLWDYVRSDRRRFLLALCQQKNLAEVKLQIGVIQEQLSTYGVEISDDTLIEDLEFLRELELIDLVGQANGGHYQLAIPLMGTWIHRQQDFAALQTRARSETEDQRD